MYDSSSSFIWLSFCHEIKILYFPPQQPWGEIFCHLVALIETYLISSLYQKGGDICDTCLKALPLSWCDHCCIYFLICRHPQFGRWHNFSITISFPCHFRVAFFSCDDEYSSAFASGVRETLTTNVVFTHFRFLVPVQVFSILLPPFSEYFCFEIIEQ